MKYTIGGDFGAVQCEETKRPIEGTTVKFYRADPDIEETRSVSARTAETFTMLDDAAVEEREDRLLGSDTTDQDGSYSATITDEEYQGEPVEVHLEVSSVGGVEAKESVQARITTIQPEWYKSEKGSKADYSAVLPERIWCAILEELGVWVVCGQVTDCESEEPVPDMTVTARDTDIIQDDDLGSATTDAQGRYCIYYRVADFERVPFGIAPVELTPGPDLYFEVQSSAGTVLLDEDRSKGREAGRENVGPCACIDLCVDFESTPDKPLFTHVGRFNVFQDIAADGTLLRARNGLGGPGWGFFGHVPLVGYVPADHHQAGGKTFYRFLYELPGESPKPVEGDLVTRTTVGGKLVPDPTAPGGMAWQEIQVAGSAGTPNPGLDPAPKTIVPTAGNRDDVENGWIPVDPGAHGGGYGHGELITLDTTAILPGSRPSATPGSAPSSPENGEEVTIHFETTSAASDGSPDTSDSAIDRQQDSATLYVNNHEEVRELAIFDGDGTEIGCSPADAVTVKYTVDHEFLNSWQLSVSSPAERPSIHNWSPPTLPGDNIDRGAHPPGTNRGPANSDSLNISSWPSCTYTIRLSSHRALTNGRRPDDGDVTPAVDGMFYKP